MCKVVEREREVRLCPVVHSLHGENELILCLPAACIYETEGPRLGNTEYNGDTPSNEILCHRLDAFIWHGSQDGAKPCDLSTNLKADVLRTKVVNEVFSW